MKKVIALALALMLALSMASVAFAAAGDVASAADTDIVGENNRLYPGEKYTIDSTAAGLLATTKSITTKWTKGGAMVASVKLKDKGKDTVRLELELNENYTISDAKDLVGTITVKDTDGTETTLDIEEVVGNDLVEVDGYSKKADAADDAIDALDNTIYKCTDAGYLAFNSDSRLFALTLKMAKDEKAFMYSDEDMIDDVEDKYGDLDAEINCYAFGGRPTFKNAAEFTLQADYADQYIVYEWDGKKLTKQDYTWNSIDGVYEWSTKSPKAYVISDKELVAADEDEEAGDKTDENPDTGANDVVGVAAALAVVSLVAAGAVSLKK